MDKQTEDAINQVLTEISDLQTAVARHRALLSQHHSALKTMASIMGMDRDVDPAP